MCIRDSRSSPHQHQPFLRHFAAQVRQAETPLRVRSQQQPFRREVPRRGAAFAAAQVSRSEIQRIRRHGSEGALRQGPGRDFHQ